MPLADAELVREFARKREARLLKDNESWEPRGPNSSDLHPCLRYQVLRVLAAKLRPLPDAAALERMENGRLMERHMRRQLEDEGWEIVEDQSSVVIEQPLVAGGPKLRVLSGKIDGRVVLARNERPPLEVKDSGEYNLVDDEDDLESSIWLLKWKAQLTSYCLATDEERGLLFIGSRGRRSPVIVHLDYERAERIVKLCVDAVRLIRELEKFREHPERLDGQLNALGVPYFERWEHCAMCWAKDRVCFPPKATERTQIVDRPDLEQLAGELYENDLAHLEYERAKRKLKEITEAVPAVLAGKYVIENTWKRRGDSGHWSMSVRLVGEKPR